MYVQECNLQSDQYVESIPVYWAVLECISELE